MGGKKPQKCWALWLGKSMLFKIFLPTLQFKGKQACFFSGPGGVFFSRLKKCEANLIFYLFFDTSKEKLTRDFFRFNFRLYCDVTAVSKLTFSYDDVIDYLKNNYLKNNFKK